MDKKKVCDMGVYVKAGFWAMLALFVIMLVFSLLRWQIPGMISGVLFVVSVFYVFVTSIKAIVPDKSMAYIALGISIVFILYLLLSATVLPSTMLS